ncbi:MAG: hypothetical protein COA60_003145 [Robiginitomaculum sp.]|nr:hypothetical protein [Robiginitomaculum sp.]
MKLRTILTYGLLAMAIPTMSLANDRTNERSTNKATKIMQKLDANNDGKITISEVAILRAKKFDDADRNSDGFISPREKKLLKFKRKNDRREKRAARRIDRQAKLDSNGDGEVSLLEFTSQASPLLTRLDSNKDGSISSSEILEARKQRFARLDVNNDGVLSRADKKDAKTKRRSKTKQARADMDTDKDGRISRAEFLANKGWFMNKFDSNSDNLVTYDEIKIAISNKKPRANKRR